MFLRRRESRLHHRRAMTRPPAPRTFAFLFVCQSGELEVKAALLAASLRRNLRVQAELIACVPEPAERWGTISEPTRALLAKLGVRIAPIRNEVADDYPIGNKISCLRVPCDADKLVFVDSDVLCVGEFRDEPRFDLPFHAKPADVATFADRAAWKRAFSACGVPFHDARVAASVYGDLQLTYFNSGWVCVDRKAGLGDVWLDACRRIDAKWRVPKKRPHLDQIALPVAIRKLGLTADVLDNRYNFPAHRIPLDPARLPWFAHYHRPEVIRREPVLADLVRDVCRAEPLLEALLATRPEWAKILRPARRALASATAATPDLLITGIPRSGTSYLCNLIHRYDNCVVVNEPDDVFHFIRHEPVPWGVVAWFRDRRRDVVEGVPIKNKLREGKVTDDTVTANDRVEYVPKVRTDDFVLGAKSPLGFLARLADLRRVMPGAPVAACVRDPVDTIASWKDSFEHLAKADVAEQKVGGLKERFLTAQRRRRLESIAEIDSAAWRRAAWWRYLAECILEAGPGVQIVRYRTLVESPEAVLDPLLRGLARGEPAETVGPSKIRSAKRSNLDAEDLAAIRALCREPAEALGVWEETA
jgi:hypothetical protein